MKLMKARNQTKVSRLGQLISCTALPHPNTFNSKFIISFNSVPLFLLYVLNFHPLIFLSSSLFYTIICDTGLS